MDRRAEWDAHGFFVERLLPDGHWTDEWSARTAATVRFRAACDCGWRGRDLTGDGASGREDDGDREQAYDEWDRLHVPDHDVRSAGAPDGT